MAGCGGKKMAYGGMAKKKMKEGGMAKNMKGFSKLPEAVQQKMSPKMAKKYEEGGKVKKGYHMMPDGTMMKDSEHKNMKKPAKKKMKSGGKVYCKDGCAVRGKTRGKLM